jgi:hypothetical protein
MSLALFRVFSLITLHRKKMDNLPLFTLAVSFIDGLSGFCFLILFNPVYSTGIAFIKMSVLHFKTRIEIRKWFDLFAPFTSFCYNRFRHNFSLFKKLCLRLLAGDELVSSSLYYTE